VASEEYRKGLKKMHAELEEAEGWGGHEVTELREEKREKALVALVAAPITRRENLPSEPISP
jgi:hypothetical protein